MPCFLENVHVHLEFTPKHWYVFWEYLRGAQSPKHFLGTLFMCLSKIHFLCHIIICHFLDFVTLCYV